MFMKKYLFVSIMLVALLTISSCGTTVWQLKTDCSPSTEEVINRITPILMEQNFLIKVNDPKTGLLQAETVPKFNFWMGMTEARYWIFQIVNNKVIAQAKIIYMKQNIFGATTGGTEIYYNDEASKDWSWYWQVRNGLETICGNKIVFLENSVQ